MTSAAIITSAALVLLLVFLYKEVLRPAVTFILVIALLMVCRVISPEEALAGFANEQLWIIVLLLLLSNTLSKTTLINDLFSTTFKGVSSARGFIGRMVLSVGLPSALLNNTPLVAMTMPFIDSWSKRRNIPSSQVLMPLSYISILGGCVTLLGTSTNLIVNGLAVEYGEESLGVFDFAAVGSVMLLLGSIYVLFTFRKLLPANAPIMEQAESREYFVEAMVRKGSKLIGQDIQSAGLRQLDGVFLAEVNRGDQQFRPVEPTLVLEEGDGLIFVGDTERVLDITSPELGLSLPKHTEMPLGDMKEVVEVVLAPQSSMRGIAVKDSDFRGRFNAAILAIHRNGQRVEGKIGDIVLEAGDAMLVIAGGDFLGTLKRTRDFYLVSKVKGLHDISRSASWLLFIGLISAIVLSVADLVPLFTSLVVLTMGTVISGMQPPAELRSKVDVDLILIIAMGLALGKAMINSGVADASANALIGALTTGGVGHTNNLLLIGGFFLITNLLAAFMTSKAAVAITLPIALSTAHGLGLPVTPFILVVAFGGAANFITPIGYQTNLMVYGPGGYSFADYLRFGLPLTLLYLVVCTLVLGWQFGL